MNDKRASDQEAKRLENLWAGQFGHDYIGRNKDAANKRDAFWKSFLDRYPAQSVLEIGCNVGANLRWITQLIPDGDIHGIDINPEALEILKKNAPKAKTIVAGARELPYPDKNFDLVFTAGVLIHQPEESLEKVMAEVYRVSKRYLLCLEYYASSTVEVPYRKQSGALFKRPYGELYQKMFSSLELLEKGQMGIGEGWDDVTYWVFQKK